MRVLSTNAEEIASALAEAGVTEVFGLPGGEILALMDALRRNGIRFYLTGHEASAAFMADVTGQIKGRVGVCLATLGPGAVNLSLGLSNAFLDRSPVLALTADIADGIRTHFPHQRLPLQRFLGSLCKKSVVIRHGSNTRQVIRKSIQLAETPPYGPVHIALPSDHATAQALKDSSERSTISITSDRSNPDAPPDSSSVLSAVVARLKVARTPLLVVGLGCGYPNAHAVRRFVHATQIPFIVTPKAKGILPEDEPGFLGVVGGMALDREVMRTVNEADLLLGVGFDPVECDKAWYVDRPIASLSPWPTAEGSYRPLEFVGEVEPALEELRSQARVASWPEDLIRACRKRLEVGSRSSPDESPLAVLRALRENLPRDTILTCDVGSHKYFAGQFWRSFEPNTFFVSNGLSAMGYGIPAALVAKLQFPERPVIALVGDGGLLMMLHNLGFIRQYKVPIVILCFVDNSLSLIRLGQERRKFEPHGVDFPAPDFAQIARGFEIPSHIATSIKEVTDLVETALESGRAALIAMPVSLKDYQAYA